MHKLLSLLLPAILLPGFAVLHAQANSARPEAITFVAYNLENYVRMNRLVPAGGQKGNAPKPEEEIQALIGTIASLHPDILGVCEMGRPDQFSDFLARLKAEGLDYPYTEYVQAADEDRHLALASKFPIVTTNSQKNLSFVLNATREYLKRGILDVTVEINPAYRLHLVGAHLKSKREVPEDDALLRRNEAHLLRLHVDDILTKSPEDNLLVYGDLNDTIDQASIREIQGSRKTPHYLSDLDLRDDRGEKWTQYWKEADTYSRIDYALVSRSLRPEIRTTQSRIARPLDWNDASDHCPLVVVLRPEEKSE